MDYGRQEREYTSQAQPCFHFDLTVLAEIVSEPRRDRWQRDGRIKRTASNP
jgi:hypothetical protein